MYCTDPNDELVKCPFNKSHILLRSRIHYHLIKCRKQYPNCNKIQCPYDATEYIEPEDFPMHLFECKHKVAIYNASHDLARTLQLEAHGDINPPTFHTPIPIDDDEYWDTGSSNTSESSYTSSPQSEPASIKLLREHLKKVFSKPTNKEKKPMGRGAMMKKLLESRE